MLLGDGQKMHCSQNVKRHLKSMIRRKRKGSILGAVTTCYICSAMHPAPHVLGISPPSSFLFASRFCSVSRWPWSSRQLTERSCYNDRVASTPCFLSSFVSTLMPGAFVLVANVPSFADFSRKKALKTKKKRNNSRAIKRAMKRVCQFCCLSTFCTPLLLLLPFYSLLPWCSLLLWFGLLCFGWPSLMPLQYFTVEAQRISTLLTLVAAV